MRYRIMCSNVPVCSYQESFTTNYIINTDNKECPECQSKLSCNEDGITNKGGNSSASLVSGVGCITNKIPSDFKDLLKSIKKGSPGCNMDKY